jgi:hypothetical protein
VTPGTLHHQSGETEETEYIEVKTRQQTAKPFKKSTTQKLSSSETPTSYVNFVGPALLPDEFASIRDLSFDKSKNLSSEETDELPFMVTLPTYSNELFIEDEHVISSVPSESETELLGTSVPDLSTKKSPTTFSDLFKERYPDSKPEATVEKINPTFRSFISPELGDEELALYGKNLSIERGVLEKEVLEIGEDGSESATLLLVAPPGHQETNAILAEKLVFKRRDIEEMPRKRMKVRYEKCSPEITFWVLEVRICFHLLIPLRENSCAL